MEYCTTETGLCIDVLMYLYKIGPYHLYTSTVATPPLKGWNNSSYQGLSIAPFVGGPSSTSFWYFTLNNHFKIFVSIGWFQTFTWKIGCITQNIHLNTWLFRVIQVVTFEIPYF